MKVKYDKDRGIELDAETLIEAFEIGAVSHYINQPKNVQVVISTVAGDLNRSKVGLLICKDALKGGN